MVLAIYTNMPSQQARRWLQQSTEATGRATCRLASGQRINEAADDISGMAMAVGLHTEVRSAAWVGRNVVDGLSLLGQADAALAQQTELLQQIRERAVQAASDNTNSQIRDILNEDAAQLKGELEHIARNTSFNGMQLLDGSFSGRSLMIGTRSTAENNLAVSMASAEPSAIGGVKTGNDVFVDDIYQNGAGAPAKAIRWALGEVTVTAGGQTTSVPVPAGSEARDYAAAFNSVKNVTGVTAEARTVWTLDNAQTTQATVSGDVFINGVFLPPFQNASASDSGPGSAVAAFNSVKNQTGVQAELGAGNKITLTAEDGRSIWMQTTADGTLATGFHNLYVGVSSNKWGGLKLTANQSFTLSDSSMFAATGLSGTSTATQTVIGATSHVSDIDLTTRQGALLAIQIADQAMSEISSQRSAIGATGNRLNSSKAVLDIAAEMAATAESRIVDTDYAVEASALSRGQIMQQAGIAVLSQANMHPQLVLTLLKGN